MMESARPIPPETDRPPDLDRLSTTPEDEPTEEESDRWGESGVDSSECFVSVLAAPVFLLESISRKKKNIDEMTNLR